MKFIAKFKTMEEAIAYKKQVLSQKAEMPQGYTLFVDDKIVTFDSIIIPNKIIVDNSNDNNRLFVQALVDNHLLGDNFDYENDRVLNENDVIYVTTLGSSICSKIANKSIEQSKYGAINDLSFLDGFDMIDDLTGFDGSNYKNLFGMVNLEYVSTPINLEELGNSAFAFCLNLKTVKLNKCLKTIKTKAFFNCMSLKKLTIPVNVQTIEANAFAKCGQLSEITFNSATPAKIYKDTFNGVSDNLKIYVPESAVEAYKSAWKYVDDSVIYAKRR